MKKSYLFVLLFLVPFLVSGQGIGIGIKAGANFANQDVTNISVETVTNYLAGAYVNVNFSKKWGLTPEVLYTVYGSKWDNASVNLDYVAIPLMLRFKPIELLSLEAGPQFSFLTKAHHETYGDVKNQLKNNDFGLAFGAGLHLPLGLNVGARYVLGFTNISEVSTESIKNRTFQVYLGWTIFGAK
jgi:hypothetical protein